MRTLSFVLVTLLAASVAPAHAGNETVDLATVSFPDGWTRTEKERTYVLHTKEDVDSGTFCQLYAYVSLPSSGNLDSDFDAEWKTLADQYKLQPATSIKGRAIKGWSMKAGQGTLEYNGRTVTVTLYVYVAGGKRLPYVVTTNDAKRYAKPIAAFLSSIKLSAPKADAPKPTGKGKTTTFDDGWTSTEETDWVRSVNGDMTALVHHRSFDMTKFVNQDGVKYVWSQLIAPRYGEISNLFVKKAWYNENADWMEADAKDASGRAVHVALFRAGNMQRWVEIIAPTRDAMYTKLGTVVEGEGTNWKSYNTLQNVNKFAIAASDLPGTWESTSGASVDYVNVYGNSAGTGYATSSSTYVFKSDGTYKGEWRGASNAQDGRGTIFGGEKYAGKYTVTNWQVTLTGMFKGKTKVFTAQFEAVSGGRILHMKSEDGQEMHLFKTK
jgi:hypothetical protein